MKITIIDKNEMFFIFEKKGFFAMVGIDSAIANCRLDIDSVKSTYSEFPEFAPHVGRAYHNNYERILVIGEIFSTKNPISDRDVNESYCSYALKNKKNPTCVKIQETLLNYDEKLSEENIAFCFFIHKKEIKVGSYRSNFSPKDLDDAMNTLMPLIDLLKPQKIIFLGSQTKRTVERRADLKVFNGKTFKQYLEGAAIKIDVISLRNLTFRQLQERYHQSKEKEELKSGLSGLDVSATRQTITAFLDSRNSLIQILLKDFKRSVGLFGKDEYINKIIEGVVALEVDFVRDVRSYNIYIQNFDEIKELSENEILMKRLAERERYDLFDIEECCGKYSETLQNYYNATLNECVECENLVDESIDFISRRLNAVSLCLNYFQEFANGYIDYESRSKNMPYLILSAELMCKYLNSKKKILHRLLIPIKAIRDNFIDSSEKLNSLMSRKIEFVKTLVRELRPKNDSDPGKVMSLQMVARKLNECDPPITTALGKAYDDSGRGVVVLLRNVYNILKSSSFQDERDIAADMLHSFAKRPVARVFVRNEENVSESEYWKPFKSVGKEGN